VNAHKGSCNRYKEGVCAEKGKVVSIVERRERRDTRVSFRIAEKGIYQTLKVTSNSTSVFCRKEGW